MFFCTPTAVHVYITYIHADRYKAGRSSDRTQPARPAYSWRIDYQSTDFAFNIYNNIKLKISTMTIGKQASKELLTNARKIIPPLLEKFHKGQGMHLFWASKTYSN